MKKIKILVIVLGFSVAVLAQKTNTTSHTIKKGENISTLARIYGVPTSEILQANGLNDKTILKIGQIIIIPKVKNKTEKNTEEKTVATQPKANSNEHVIQSGETLSRIAKKYGVSEKNLMEWNNLSNSNIRAGSTLIVKKSGEKKSNKPPKEEPKEIVKETPKKVEPVTEKPKQIIEEKKEIVKETPKKIDPTIDTPKVDVVKEVVTTTPKDIKPESLGKGAFEKQFENSNNSVEGMCGVFKTIAGWHDTKYYILLNNADNGSVVKVSANNKFIYAKVLGPLPDIKSDKNIVMRISNAAAAALGITDTKFNAKVEF